MPKIEFLQHSKKKKLKKLVGKDRFEEFKFFLKFSLLLNDNLEKGVGTVKWYDVL